MLRVPRCGHSNPVLDLGCRKVVFEDIKRMTTRLVITIVVAKLVRESLNG